MRRGKLKSLKSNIKSFFKEFKNYDIHEISDEKLNSLITDNQLDINSVYYQSFEDFYHKKGT